AWLEPFPFALPPQPVHDVPGGDDCRQHSEHRLDRCHPRRSAHTSTRSPTPSNPRTSCPCASSTTVNRPRSHWKTASFWTVKLLPVNTSSTPPSGSGFTWKTPVAFSVTASPVAPLTKVAVNCGK